MINQSLRKKSSAAFSLRTWFADGKVVAMFGIRGESLLPATLDWTINPSKNRSIARNRTGHLMSCLKLHQERIHELQGEHELQVQTVQPRKTLSADSGRCSGLVV